MSGTEAELALKVCYLLRACSASKESLPQVPFSLSHSSPTYYMNPSVRSVEGKSSTVADASQRAHCQQTRTKSYSVASASTTTKNRKSTAKAPSSTVTWQPRTRILLLPRRRYHTDQESKETTAAATMMMMVVIGRRRQSLRPRRRSKRRARRDRKPELLSSMLISSEMLFGSRDRGS